MMGKLKHWILTISILMWTIVSSFYLWQMFGLFATGWGIGWLAISFYVFVVSFAPNDFEPFDSIKRPMKKEVARYIAVIGGCVILFMICAITSLSGVWVIVKFLVLPTCIFIILYYSIKLLDYLFSDPGPTTEYVDERNIPETIEQKRAREDLEARNIMRLRYGRKP